MRTVFPADLGYSMPAEWERHEATWLSWPHNTDTWPLYGKQEPVWFAYAEIIKALSPFEKVRINIPDTELKRKAGDLLAKTGCFMENVEFFLHPTNDAWCRDHGPIFIKKPGGEKAITNWEYNAWGGKYPPYTDDNQVPLKIAEYFGLPVFTTGIVMEGGSLEVNGKGTLLTTKACLLNKNRNPHLSQQEIEKYLKNYLGVNHVLWLNDGIIGDDTDGHVDDLTRFVNENTLVTIVEDHRSDENYGILKENLELLEKMTDQEGRPFNIITLPMPAAVFRDGIRLPASYANFYIANSVVLVPVFGDRNDELALEILQAQFPGRTVKGIYCRDLVWGLGTLHCISQQEPA